MTPPDEPWSPSDADAPDAPPKLRDAASLTDDELWESGLTYGKTGPHCTLANAIHALSKAPEWRGVLAFNEFDGSVVKLKKPPMAPGEAPQGYELGEWTDTDTSLCCAWLARRGNIRVQPNIAGRAAYTVAQQQKFHPVRQYADALVWDGKVRLNSWLSRYLGAEQNAYTEAIGKRWLISAIARVYDPGCKADHALVLEGQQGIGKSSALEVLAGMGWFSDTPVVFGEKDSYEALRGVWIYELAELAALRKSDVEAQKAYISKRHDRYRRPYGEGNTTWRRQCIFAGTTNDNRYLIDPSGNRRFWPVSCGQVDLEALRADRDQIWAEALVRYREGEAWHLDSNELVVLASRVQLSRVLEDDWETLIARWLDSDAGKYEIGRGHGIAITDVLLLAVKLKEDKIETRTSTRAGIIMRKLGWGYRGRLTLPGKRLRERRLFQSKAEWEMAVAKTASEQPAGVEVVQEGGPDD